MDIKDRYSVICIVSACLGQEPPPENGEWQYLTEEDLLSVFSTPGKFYFKPEHEYIDNPFKGCKTLTEVALKAELLGAK